MSETLGVIFLSFSGVLFLVFITKALWNSIHAQREYRAILRELRRLVEQEKDDRRFLEIVREARNDFESDF